MAATGDVTWGRRHVRALPLAGLAVMLVAGVLAGPYTPSWFDGRQPCTGFSAPCPVDVDPQLALRALSWTAWGGLVLVLGGVALAAALLAARDGDRGAPGAETGLPTRRAVAHAGVAGAAAAAVSAVGAWAAFVAGLAASSQLALGVVVVAWLGLGRLLESIHVGLGRARGAGTAYLLSLGVGTVACLAMGAALLAVEAQGWWGAVAAAGLAAATATGLADAVAWDRQPAARTLGGVVAAAVAMVALAGCLSLLGLLRPLDTPAVAGARTDTVAPPSVQPQQPPPARPTGPATPSASPATADPGVRTARRCAADDLRLGLTGFDAAMGARVASLEAVNRSGSPCYVDGFVTVTLSQGGTTLDVRSGTTSTSQPGMEGRATRVGLAPRGTARAVLYWRGYGAAADTTAPQTLTVTLHRGAPEQPVTVEPYAFDLASGGELRVGNWVLAG